MQTVNRLSILQNLPRRTERLKPRSVRNSLPLCKYAGTSALGLPTACTEEVMPRTSRANISAVIPGRFSESSPMWQGKKNLDSLWLAATPSKRWGELFFLAYTPFWLILCLGIVVPFRLYEKFGELEYFLLGLVSALPSVILPIFLVGKADLEKPIWRRYWFKASLWVAIFSYVGNFFWTHYFFTVLGASYTFPSWRFNNVPWTTFFLTHCCFLFYHTVSNLTLRRLRHVFGKDSRRFLRWIAEALWILALSYATAFSEAWAISEFPYYSFVDREAMFKVGSVFYAIYFIVSYPMFLRLDEDPQDSWSLSRTAIDSLAAAMLVTIFLDAWRLFIGPIVDIPNSVTYKDCLKYGIPWMS